MRLSRATIEAARTVLVMNWRALRTLPSLGSFFWEGDWIVVENHCNYDILKRY